MELDDNSLSFDLNDFPNVKYYATEEEASRHMLGYFDEALNTRITYSSPKQALVVLRKLKALAKAVGFVTISDMYLASGILKSCSNRESFYGYSLDDLYNVELRRDESLMFYLDLPEPKELPDEL